MILSDKNKFEFEIRDIGGSDVYYKRKIGDFIWLFSTKDDFEKNNNFMDEKYTQLDIERGAEIEMEHKKTIEKYMKDGTDVKDVARAIAIDHLEENPLSYSNSKGVCMSEPLMIRLFELMNEDIKSDVDLHKVSEKVITASRNKDILTMDDYESFLLNTPKEESYSIGGGVKQKEKSNRIECCNPKCDWSWDIEKGGDDKFICHKCHTDNEKFYKNGGLIAPNGKPSRLTPEQYRLVRTSEFKEWFGDWENNPANASKVVDENGEPLVCYHGTDNNFSVFNKNIIGSASGENREKNGFYFTSDYENAKHYADLYTNNGEYSKSIILECFLQIKNAFILDEIAVDDLLSLITEKYDNYQGVIVNKVSDGRFISDQIVVFEPEQIKLADGTNTTFNGNNPNIRFEDGGGVLLAPNGGFSYLNSKEHKLVRTPAFKEWFGDWEKAYETDSYDNVSKVIGYNVKGYSGEPLICSHSSYNKFNEFKTPTFFQEGQGGYAYLDKSDENYVVYNCFLSIKKPLELRSEFLKENFLPLISEILKNANIENEDYKSRMEFADKYADRYGLFKIIEKNIWRNEYGYNWDWVFDYCKKNGYDGFVMKDSDQSMQNRITTWVAFEPEQIKLADGTNTTFDGSNPDIRFDDGGSVANDKLVALHNINSNQIISADKLGGLITPSIAILKAGDKFTDFGSITLIADKNLVNPQNYDTRVFAGDVYSPTVPRKLFYVDSKKYDNVTLKLINKSFEYDSSKEIYHIANNLLSDYNNFYKDLSKLSFEDLNKNYSDKMRIIYLVDKDIPVKIPMKESRHILWNNVEFTLTEEQKKRFKPVLDEYRKQSNESNLSKEIKSEVYDLMLEVLDDIKRDLKEKYNENTDRYEILKDSLKKSFEDYVGERYTFGDSPVYRLSEAVFGKKELNENQLNININKIFTKSLKEDYKQWLSDFISQFRGYAYFLKGTQKIPYTLDNLVDATSNAIVGQEKNMTFGVNQAKSFGTKEFKTIDEMKKKSNVLITKEEMNEVDKENSDKFFKVADELKYEYSDSWGKLDSLGRALADYFKGKSVHSALVKNDFKSPNSFQEDSFLELANQLKNSPVDYFEAKLGRAVKLSEFKYAVVPYETEKQVLDILKKNDLKIKKYKTEEERIMVTKDILNKDKKITFEDGGKIQLNSNRGKVNLKLSNYEDVTELVPVSELLKLREFNRYERPKYSLDDSKDNISKLEDELVNNGVEEPLIIEYSLADNSVLLIEGNHRLNVADNLGFDYLPARVVLRRREFTPLQKTKAFKVKGFTPDKYGYVPSDLKPSQVGIGGTTKAFEDGGIVEGQLHSECNDETGCGEKYDVGGVGHIIEVERDEAVIVSKAFLINDEFEVKGTCSQIASALNVLGDGKNFDSGAEIKRQDGKKIEVSQIKKEAKDTDVETIDPNSIIINRRSMADKNIYIAKGTPKQIASQINNINDNGVKIVDGGSIQKT